MNYFYRNISGWPVFGWSLWHKIEDEWQRRIQPTSKIKEQERWHLREFHSKRRVQYLARWLCSNLQTFDHSVVVGVESIWVDHTPQAEGTYSESNSSVQVKCELADILLIIRVAVPGVPLYEKATLIQAKCVDDPRVLDPNAPHDSTDDERNLLERCDSNFVVKTGTKSTARLLNPKKLSYHLPEVAKGKIGLEDYASYLLIPRGMAPYSEPYFLLWPDDRGVQYGPLESFGMAMLGMTGLYGNKFGDIGQVLELGGTDDWNELVNDLRDHYKGKATGKFSKATKVKIPRTVDSGDYCGALLPKLSQLLRSIGRSLATLATNNLPSFQYNIVPYETQIPPENGHDTDQEFDEPNGGFGIITVNVTLSNKLERHPERHG